MPLVFLGLLCLVAWTKYLLLGLTIGSLMALGIFVEIAVVGFLMLPYGKWFGLANFFLEVSAEATPEGTSTVSHVLARTFFRDVDDERTLSRGLAHSCTYTNLNVIDEIITWIKKGDSGDTKQINPVIPGT